MGQVIAPFGAYLSFTDVPQFDGAWVWSQVLRPAIMSFRLSAISDAPVYLQEGPSG